MADKWRDLCTTKIVAPAEALQAIRPGNRVFIGSACGEPQELVRAMTEFGDRLDDTEVIHVLTLGVAPYAQPKYAQKFRPNAFFIGSSVRDAVNEARADYTPIFLSQLPGLFRSRRIAIDVALVMVSPPDDHGNCSLGVSVDITKAAVESAKLVIAQVNRHMPRAHGDCFLSARAYRSS
jgi:4-hydroxybutyrate CoA-transferase